jgi:hypothetical protein
MSVDPQRQADTLARAYATLEALRKNIPEGYHIPAVYVTEYHRALDHLQSLGVDVAEFRVPPEEVQRRATSANARTGQVRYRDQPEVRRDFLLVKLDTILRYFELITVQPEQPIRRLGFRTPENI